MLIEHSNLVCLGNNTVVWIYIIFIYLIAQQAVGVYLAVRTRKVKIKVLNDAKYLALIIYITTLIIIVMILCSILLEDYLNADAAVFSTGLLLYSTSILVFLFVPKVQLCVFIYT